MGSISILAMAFLTFTAMLSWHNTEDNNLITDSAGLVYEIDSSTDECTVVSYNGSSRKVIIPDEYQEYTVTSISDNALHFANQYIR